MKDRDYPSLGKILFVVGLSACLAWGLPAYVSSQDDPRKVSELPPDIGRTDLSIKDLPPEVRELLLKMSKAKAGPKKLYWKKPKPMISGGVGGGPSAPRWASSPENLFYNEGVEYLYQGEYFKAASKFQEVLRHNPRNGGAIFNSGLAYAFQGHYDKALAEFSKYLTMDTKDAEAYYSRGLVYTQKGQYDQALADLKKALEINSKDAQTYYLLGFIRLKKGDLDQAGRDYQKASGLDPDLIRQFREGKSELDTYASLLEGKKPVGKAAAAPQADTAHKQQALAYARRKEYDQALSELNQAIKIDAKDAESYNNRGSIYTFKGRYQEALADFDQALKLNPRYAKAHYNRGLAYYYLGNYQNALADLTKAIELNPKDAEAYHNRGLAHNQLGQTERALEDFNMTIALNPKLADAYFNKAAALERTGDASEAREAYQAFLKYAPAEATDRIKYARQKVTQ